jgi:hypothetical protein
MPPKVASFVGLFGVVRWSLPQAFLSSFSALLVHVHVQLCGNCEKATLPKLKAPTAEIKESEYPYPYPKGQTRSKRV